MKAWIKKVNKHAADLFDADETIVHAFPAQPAGTIAKQAIGGGIGGVTGMLIAKKMGEKKANEQAATLAGMAATFPNVAMILVATPRRVVVTDQTAGRARPTKILAEFSYKDIVSIDVDKKKLTKTVRMTFNDNSVKEIEAAKMVKLAGFVEYAQARLGTRIS